MCALDGWMIAGIGDLGKRVFAEYSHSKARRILRKIEEGWRPEQESNLRCVLRRDSFYPLNYRGASSAQPQMRGDWVPSA